MMAEEALVTYGKPRPKNLVDAHDMLLEEIARTAGHVDWLSGKVRELAPDALANGVRKITEREIVGSDASLLIERTTETMTAVNIWLDMYWRERKHLTEVCKVAIAAGIAERQVQLAEQQGALIVQIIQASLAEVGYAGNEDIPAIVSRHLRMLGAGALDTEATEP